MNYSDGTPIYGSINFADILPGLMRLMAELGESTLFGRGQL